MQAAQSGTNRDLFNKLLEEAKALGEIELRAFIGALVNLLHPKEPDEEEDLIQKLKDHQPSEAFWKEYNLLANQSDEESLTDKDRERFQTMAKEVRVWELKRLQIAVDLSKMWETPLNKTMRIIETVLTSPADVE
jgi:hypothetical protein